MFYRKLNSWIYISLPSFRFEHFLFDQKRKSKLQSVSQLHHVFNLKNSRSNNRDFNIDQNNRDYDFFP